MRSRAVLVAIAGCALLPISGSAAGLAWQPWVSETGVFDLGGPRSDGSLILAGSGALYTVSPDGTVTHFAVGAGGGAEAYLAVSPGLHVAAADCDFAKDDLYVLRLTPPVGVTRMAKSGQVTTALANVDTPGLNGIAFDTVGSFDHRLLVTGGVNGKTELAAIDCTGAVQVITKTAPVVEGGLAVAPMSFGFFGGSLIAPDEVSGVIWAIGPDGTSHQVVDSGLPKGGDIGVESVAFVPAGFSRGGFLYYSDRATPSNPHPGTDHVLRLSSVDLVAAGVQDGDLLAATEGGASMIDVRCSTTCSIATVVGTPTTAHGEGHLVFAVHQVQASPGASPTVKPAPAGRPAPGTPFVAIAAALVAAVVAALVAASRRR